MLWFLTKQMYKSLRQNVILSFHHCNVHLTKESKREQVIDKLRLFTLWVSLDETCPVEVVNFLPNELVHHVSVVPRGYEVWIWRHQLRCTLVRILSVVAFFCTGLIAYDWLWWSWVWGVCISDRQTERFEGSPTKKLGCSSCICGYNGVLGSRTTWEIVRIYY